MKGELSKSDNVLYSQKETAKIVEIFKICIEHKELLGDEKINKIKKNVTYTQLIMNWAIYPKRDIFYEQITESVVNYYELIGKYVVRKKEGNLSEEYNNAFIIEKATRLMDVFGICILHIKLLTDPMLEE